uniref:Uncharacterized protein n=1 Tax=Rhizophora mucronata TaxID=61149 RepID=A0A2P2NRL6_RHIMU
MCISVCGYLAVLAQTCVIVIQSTIWTRHSFVTFQAFLRPFYLTIKAAVIS